jgi:hypothetical protein
MIHTGVAKHLSQLVGFHEYLLMLLVDTIHADTKTFFPHFETPPLSGEFSGHNAMQILKANTSLLQ